MLAHDNLLAGALSFHGIIKPMEHRIVSLLPLSHSLEQIVCLFYAMDVGADILYVRSAEPAGHLRQPPRAPGHDDAARAPGARPVLERDRARGRAAGRRRKQFERLRSIARRLPYAARRLLFRSVHAQLGGGLRLFATAGAFLPPALQQAWEDMGVIVLQGYGATETAAGLGDDDGRPPPGLRRAGRRKPVEMRIVEDGEIQFRGPTLLKGYWNNPEATAAAFTEDGWYKSATSGSSTTRAGSTSTAARRT